MSITDDAVFHVSAVTLEAWFKLANASDTSANNPSIAGKPYLSGVGGTPTNDSWTMWFQYGQFNAGIMAASPTTVASYAWPADTNWHHAAVTYDPATEKQILYVDGVEVASATTSQVLGYDSSPVLIGMDYDNGGYSGGWLGELSDVRIWGVARTAAQISQDLTSCVTGSEANLVAAWPLDDGSGVVARDLTSGQHDGVLGSVNFGGTNPSWVEDAPPE